MYKKGDRVLELRSKGDGYFAHDVASSKQTKYQANKAELKADGAQHEARCPNFEEHTVEEGGKRGVERKHRSLF